MPDTFMDSNGADMRPTPYGVNAYVAEVGARMAARNTLKPGTVFYIWRLGDGSFDFSAVPDPSPPRFQSAELIGHGRV